MDSSALGVNTLQICPATLFLCSPGRSISIRVHVLLHGHALLAAVCTANKLAAHLICSSLASTLRCGACCAVKAAQQEL